MKRLLLSVLFVAGCFISNAQNATLTKGETIEYIKKKLKESVGMVSREYKTRFEKITGADILMIGDDVTVTYYQTTYAKADDAVIDKAWHQVTFNPALIASVSVMKEDSPDVESVFLRFKNNSVKHAADGTTGWTSDSATILFPKGDGTYGEKIKKAFMHLIALLKAEDDPFQKP